MTLDGAAAWFRQPVLVGRHLEEYAMAVLDSGTSRLRLRNLSPGARRDLSPLADGPMGNPWSR